MRRTPIGKEYYGAAECAICGMGSGGRVKQPKNELLKQNGLLICPDCYDETGPVKKHRRR